MTPRGFIDFFKTNTGKILLFAVVFGGGLVLFSSLRSPNGKAIEMLAPSRTNQEPQVVQTVERPIELFRPPPPPKPKPIEPKEDKPIGIIEPPQPKEPPPLPPISLFADGAVGQPEPEPPATYDAPFGRLIPCETVITVDSASIQTPIVGLVTEDIYHGGKLLIPAGTELHGSAQTDRQRERIASATSWTLVWQTGEQLNLKALALDREFSGDQEGWGITDGSAGLRGRLIKADDLAEIKLFAATLLSGAASALTEKETTLLGTIDRPSLNNAPIKGVQQVLEIYAERILDAIERDGFYVRVPSGKQFYLYVLQPIDLSAMTHSATAAAGTAFLATDPPIVDPPSLP